MVAGHPRVHRETALPANVRMRVGSQPGSIMCKLSGGHARLTSGISEAR
jgi:hypothetical protein